MFNRGIGQYWLTAMVFATTPLACKISILPGGFTPPVACTLRMTIAVICCLLAWAFSQRQKDTFIERAELPWLLVAGVSNTVAFGLVYFALARLPSAMLPFTMGLVPFFVSAIMHVFRLEAISRVTLIGCMIALAGVVMLSVQGLDGKATASSPNLWAMAALLGGAVLVALTTVMIGPAPRSSKLGVQFVTYGIGTVLLWIWLSTTQMPSSFSVPSLPAVLAMVYSGAVGSFVGFMLYLRVFRSSGAVTASSLILVQAPLALCLSAWLEPGTHISASTAIALGIVFLGVSLGWMRQASPVTTSPLPTRGELEPTSIEPVA